MTSKAERAAELAATLSADAHFVQASPTLRPAYYAVPAPHQVASDALALLRIGASVSRWAVRECNGEGHREYRHGRRDPNCLDWAWSEDDDAAKERADASALKRATEIAERYGATVKLGGDPRGYVLRLVLASGRTNTMGNDGWGVA